MKAATIIRLAIGVFIIPFLVSFLARPVLQAQAQGVQAQQAQEAQTQQAQDSSYPEPSAKYSPEELTQMLAPIALYPDALLSQVLMASTYPIEVIEADRWVRKNPELKDEALDDALLAKDWDPSVKAVCHVPSVLALMSERIAETTNIGNAFLAQEDEVLDMVQELRAKAYAQGNISTSKEQKVIVEKETIIIEQADPRVIYVPYYDPWYIYGPWWYPAYPPYYWGPPGVSIGIGISYWPGIYFGFAYSSWSYVDWHYNYVHIDGHRRPRYVRYDHWRAKPGRWNHAPSHRRGVAYRDKPTARKYGQYHSRTREFRAGTRGFPESRDGDRRSTGTRTGIDRDRRADATTRSGRDQQERQRPDSDRQERERTSRDQQQLSRTEPERQTRQRVEASQQLQQRPGSEPERQTRQRVEASQQLQQRPGSEPERQTRQRVEASQQLQQRPGSEPERQARQRVEASQQMQPRIEQQRGTLERVERPQYQRSGDDVFNRVEDGRMERQSSERGRTSRQGQGNYPRGSNRSGSDNRGGQGGRSRGGR